ncbi:hypothetical protein MVEN_01073300 [Mycena venus]|uniref:DUF6593 domain-containing protein n=1 Tax=Mycena venus TaxID=2733690 RepID=A0A8H7CX76_9AGAR|nr:hypothetical protein MVEN_01073300 [Mycena venus]
MQLVLTTASPTNAVYTDASGAPQYKVNTPLKAHNRTTTISRVVERGIPRRNSGSSAGGSESEAEGSARFANLASIDWRVFESSVIRFRGQELAVHDFFRKVGWGWYGRHRVFTAPDGREFKWILGAYTSQLKLNDAAETPVACYRPKKLDLFSKPRKASLEVLPPFEGMLDEIIVTFVYIEHLRKKKERAARSPTLLNK